MLRTYGWTYIRRVTLNASRHIVAWGIEIENLYFYCLDRLI